MKQNETKTSWGLRPGIVVVRNLSGTGTLVDRFRRRRFYIDENALKLFRRICETGQVPVKLAQSGWFRAHHEFFCQGYVDVNSPKPSFRTYNCAIPLVDVQVEITQKCNLHCKHCYLGQKYIDHDLDLATIQGVIDQAVQLGCIELHITGGEPFLNPDCLNIIQYAYECGLEYSVFTNGTVLNDQIMETFKRFPPEMVRISVDGENANVHDSVRGVRGCYARTMRNIGILKDHNIPVQVNTCIHKNNLSHTSKIVSSLQAHKLSFRIDSYVPMHGPEGDALFITPDEFLDHVSDELADRIHLGATTCHTSSMSFYCGAGNSYVFIKADGAVVFCPTMPAAFNGGNIRTASLSDIWLNGEFFNHFRNINCEFYAECPVNYLCKGGCRSRSQLIYGKINHADLQMCKYLKRVTGLTPPSLLGDSDEK